MIFQQIKVGNMDNFAYVIADSKTKEAAIVDPGWDAGILLDFCNKNNLKIKKILLTHTHYDHINDVEYIFKKTNAEVYAHSSEAEPIRKINNKIKIIGFKNRDKINVGKIEIEVLHTPGHSPGSSCFIFDGKIITGDTLFVGSIGRTDLPGGDLKVMAESLKRLKELDGNLEVYPGHDYGGKPFSTIDFERKNNSYLE
ncbi:MBL fold metallo-hydrolase [Candidatus Woesearchaeota archaeon]|nr:MBL fold metallo-hydrolase [Candidatus Woesearchaeota archaeon]MBI2130474.1 MBL fold metallo-hydrolase [Candidatus Woesearchaeota archaeon]